MPRPPEPHKLTLLLAVLASFVALMVAGPLGGASTAARVWASAFVALAVLLIVAGWVGNAGAWRTAGARRARFTAVLVLFTLPGLILAAGAVVMLA